MAANGGSDLHGHEADGRTPGTPTTVVYADALSRDALVAALRAGRSFITRHPAGVELYLDAWTNHGSATSVGGALRVRPDDEVTVRAVVRHGAGTALELHGGGRSLARTAITTDPATIATQVPAAAGYVRAEVRRPPGGGPGRTPSVLEALTNPIFLDPTPDADREPYHAPPPDGLG